VTTARQTPDGSLAPVKQTAPASPFAAWAVVIALLVTIGPLFLRMPITDDAAL